MVVIRSFTSILKNKFLLYLLLTLIPTVAISTVLAQHQVKFLEDQNQYKAQEYANLHTQNIENLLGETVGRLEMLATSIKYQKNNLNDVENLLRETMGKDLRLSGFFWTNANGDLLISTNTNSKNINVSDQPYFQQAIKTEKTSFSEVHIGRVTGRQIISIATPIINHGQLQGVLVASLRIDEIKAAIKNHVKDEMVIVTDGSDHILLTAGSVPEESSIKSSMKIAKIPLTISVLVRSENDLAFWKPFLKYLIIFLTISNIIFLSAQYFLLKRKIKKENEQTELHKLELIGKLAASTAHEIRNPLTGIKGLVKLLSEEYQDKKTQSYFEVIQMEIDRINVIVSELLVLGKPTAHTLKTYNANSIVAEIEPIIHSEANYMNVVLTVDYHSEELLVSCVKDQLKQVILNLTKNSLQAMPYGGKFSITLHKQLDNCLITVTDNGVGMQKDQISQAFNPFFTLKKDGSGLGLTVCKRIIDSYGGKISIKSNPNEGTQVVITLPLVIDENSD
ncbi:two-component system, sporulation sensor kinase D [Bacillus sp. OV166]|uniref:ATP-binding protein n=1 Tax=Bacillus sp. OV166 TaxID=1882763 RepID=UPI000A2ABD06|nr:ATP-binding protein [Bacillus sp. OV166]SMQ64816.1 two-component system, sporulation sensor kinase D [Bacillus sp. OV166]